MNHIGEKEISLEDFIKVLFKTEPKEPKCFGISFFNQDSITDLKEVFENLLIIFTEGMKKLYGENGKVNLDKLTENDITYFNHYMLSIGLTINIDIKLLQEGVNDFKHLKYTNINITNQTKLGDLKLPFLTQSKVYIISFNFI